MSTHRRPTWQVVLAGAAALLVSLPAAPASAHGDRERMQKMQETYSATANVPVVTNGPVTHVRQVPGQAGISGCFMKTEALFVTSGLDSVKVWDVSDPAAPTQLGALESAQFENEAMNCGERQTKHGVRRFALIGLDLYQAAPNENDSLAAAVHDEPLLTLEHA